MKEYIERVAVLSYPIRKDQCDKEHANEHFIFGIESVMEYVENLPAANVAPVVYCKDCIHSISYVNKSGAIAYVVCNLDEDSDEIELRTPMDYCSYGEREGANT